MRSQVQEQKTTLNRVYTSWQVAKKSGHEKHKNNMKIGWS